MFRTYFFVSRAFEIEQITFSPAVLASRLMVFSPLWSAAVASGYLPCAWTDSPFSNKSLKIASATFLLVWFVCLKESTCKTRKNVFYFISKALFVLEIHNEILNFQIFKCHDVIKCLSMKHGTHFVEQLGK